MFAATTEDRPTPVTTIQNNLNLRRIYGFRAKLQTPQFVSTPSCVTMKLNRGVFPGKKTRDRSIERLQDMQLLSFQQKVPKETLLFQRFSGQRASATECGC